MPKHRAELFGQIIYDPEISYDELLGLENDMKNFTLSTLEDCRAQFISFESEGDRTFFQCAFQECRQDLSEKIAAIFASRMTKQLECKLFFVDKMLYEHYFYIVTPRGGKAKKLTLPEAGPIDKALAAEGV